VTDPLMITSTHFRLSVNAIPQPQLTENHTQTLLIFQQSSSLKMMSLLQFALFLPALLEGQIPDGIRPQHLRDLTSNKETGPALISSLTAFINLLMMGKCPYAVSSVFFGG